MSIEDHLRKLIDICGPMDLGTYMETCLAHPKFGYYASRDPFGQEGDFVTAPEMSQIFGELIGAWVVDLWQRSGQPAFTLLECGPGRGTLMADIMRAATKIPGFKDAADIHLVEMSSELRKKQQEALKEYDVSWHEDLRNVPGDKPIICIANEFLDALPVRQLVKTDDGWLEKCVTIDDSHMLSYTTRPAEPEIVQFLPEYSEKAEPGAVYEISPERLNWLLFFAQKIKGTTGIALFIDYGYYGKGAGDTFQAVKNHAYANPLDGPGTSDLTAHVDFAHISDVADQSYLSSYGPVTQKDFLARLGIELRAQTLKKDKDKQTQDKIDLDVHRLTHSDEMGTLFKVMAMANQAFPKPVGFDGSEDG